MSDFITNTAEEVRPAGPMSHPLTPYALSVLIPVYNEENTIAALLESVLCRSATRTAWVWRSSLSMTHLATLRQRYCANMRTATRTLFGFFNMSRIRARAQRSGPHPSTLVASFHSSRMPISNTAPANIPKLLKPLLENRADAVYGSRFSVGSERRVLYFWHALANQILTTACNIVADLNLTDMETCYKAFRTSLLQSIPIRSNRFGIEPEITIKLAQRQASIYETPISYHGRTYEEGKKIGWKDAFEAFYLILKYGVLHDIYKDPGQEILHAFSYAPEVQSLDGRYHPALLRSSRA